MSEPFDRAVIYKLALSRPEETEPGIFPTAIIFPAPDDLESMTAPAIYARGWQIIERGLRNLSPRSVYTVVSPVGTPEPIDIGGGFEDFHPEFEEAGWRVFINWEPAIDR